MIVESGMQHFLCQNCHQQIIFVEFNRNVYCLLLFEKSIFHNGQANADHIQQVTNLFGWKNAVLKIDVNVQISIFSETVLNILNTYILDEVKICKDRDPHWMTTKFKQLIFQKNKLYSRFRKKNSFLSAIDWRLTISFK